MRNCALEDGVRRECLAAAARPAPPPVLAGVAVLAALASVAVLTANSKAFFGSLFESGEGAETATAIAPAAVDTTPAAATVAVATVARRWRATDF